MNRFTTSSFAYLIDNGAAFISQSFFRTITGDAQIPILGIRPIGSDICDNGADSMFINYIDWN